MVYLLQFLRVVPAAAHASVPFAIGTEAALVFVEIFHDSGDRVLFRLAFESGLRASSSSSSCDACLLLHGGEFGNVPGRALRLHQVLHPPIARFRRLRSPHACTAKPAHSLDRFLVMTIGANCRFGHDLGNGLYGREFVYPLQLLGVVLTGHAALPLAFHAKVALVFRKILLDFLLHVSDLLQSLSLLLLLSKQRGLVVVLRFRTTFVLHRRKLMHKHRHLLPFRRRRQITNVRIASLHLDIIPQTITAESALLLHPLRIITDRARSVGHHDLGNGGDGRDPLLFFDGPGVILAGLAVGTGPFAFAAPIFLVRGKVSDNVIFVQSMEFVIEDVVVVGSVCFDIIGRVSVANPIHRCIQWNVQGFLETPNLPRKFGPFSIDIVPILLPLFQ
mmetsp:Transcript_18492/g.31761  ORF Transcript_18492/g.31761 Transcript_18492/m.31761 type:complete len:390 (+) Transcript_18492:268-1437(+)